jgi:hypothetical protein
VWTYDCAAPESSARRAATVTYQGAFVRNVTSGLNDYHGIADAPNVKKVPVIFGGLFPMVVFYAAADIACGAECLVEYGVDWYRTFCDYNPSATDIFFGQKKTTFHLPASSAELIV